MTKLWSDLTKDQKKERGIVISWSIDQFTSCCGGKEIGSFSQHERPRYIENYYDKGYSENRIFKSVEAGWKHEIPKMRNQTFGYPLMFNVLEDETPELAKLLRAEPDCKEVMQWYNPNTGNIITMFILTNGADNTPKDNYEDDDY